MMCDARLEKVSSIACTRRSSVRDQHWPDLLATFNHGADAWSIAASMRNALAEGGTGTLEKTLTLDVGRQLRAIRAGRRTYHR